MVAKIQLAGYSLYKAGHNQSTWDPEAAFPMRTIYFGGQSAFAETNSFTYDIALTYKLQMDIIRLDFKSGVEALLKANPIRAIFLGVRIGDPTARDVWAFLLTFKVPYSSLYDQGYTSIGCIHDTVSNKLLCQSKSDNGEEKFKPAYLLPDGRLERAGRVKKLTPQPLPTFSNGLANVDCMPTA